MSEWTQRIIHRQTKSANNAVHTKPPIARFAKGERFSGGSVTAGVLLLRPNRTIMISDVEEYFVNGCGRCDRFATSECSTRQWSGGLAKLRQICLGAALIETVKWGHPCYMYADRNVVIIGALRDDFRLSFFNAALMTDPDGVLEKQGPNTQYPDMIRFTANSQVAKMKSIIESYLVEAIGYAEAGIRPPKHTWDGELPDELLVALESDPELADAFYGLTPGRQRSYVINLNSAKKAETRISRIEKFRDKILAGKGAMER